MARSPQGYVPPTALPFRKGSVAWTVNMEPVIGVGGGRALLLQVMHPLVAAGVEQHSNFDRDPFRRGFRTADVMLKLAFAEPPVSARQAGLLRRMHEKVKGVSTDGVPYSAMEPDLLLWVWATLVDVSVRVYEAAVRPLTALERERFYQEQKLIAHACGIPHGHCPATFDDFTDYVRSVMDSTLRVTRVAQVVAFAGQHPPLPWPLAPLAGAVGAFFTAALLPPSFRSPLSYAWSPAKERLLRIAFFLSRVASRVIPRRIREIPNRYLTRRKTALGWWQNRPIRLPPELVAVLADEQHGGTPRPQ